VNQPTINQWNMAFLQESQSDKPYESKAGYDYWHEDQQHTILGDGSKKRAGSPKHVSEKKDGK
jgi:hypothetical protein